VTRGDEPACDAFAHRAESEKADIHDTTSFVAVTSPAANELWVAGAKKTPGIAARGFL